MKKRTQQPARAAERPVTFATPAGVYVLYIRPMPLEEFERFQQRIEATLSPELDEQAVVCRLASVIEPHLSYIRAVVDTALVRRLWVADVLKGYVPPENDLLLFVLYCAMYSKNGWDRLFYALAMPQGAYTVSA
jgi:hypothetical protein